MARPKTGLPRRYPVSVLLTPEVKARIDRARERTGLTRSRWIEVRILDFLELFEGAERTRGAAE